MSQGDDGKYGNDQPEDDSTVPYKSLPGHIRAACEVLYCCSTESSLRCDSFILFLIHCSRTLCCPWLCSVIKSCASLDELWRLHQDGMSERCPGFLSNFVRDSVTCYDGSWKPAVWSFLGYVAGIGECSLF